MDHCSATKQGWLLQEIISKQVLTITTPLLLLFGLPLFTLFSLLLSLINGLFVNLMLKMPFFMAFSLKQFTCDNLLVSLILDFLLTCADSKRLSMAWNKPHVLSLIALVVFCAHMDSLVASRIPPCLLFKMHLIFLSSSLCWRYHFGWQFCVSSFLLYRHTF